MPQPSQGSELVESGTDRPTSTPYPGSCEAPRLSHRSGTDYDPRPPSEKVQPNQGGAFSIKTGTNLLKLTGSPRRICGFVTKVTEKSKKINTLLHIVGEWMRLYGGSLHLPMTAQGVNLMTNQSMPPVNRQPIARKTSFLGLLFFLLGAPNLYIFFNRQQANFTATTSRYGWIAAIALIMAGAVELSVISMG